MVLTMFHILIFTYRIDIDSDIFAKYSNSTAHLYGSLRCKIAANTAIFDLISLLIEDFLVLVPFESLVIL